jgi:ferric-dicitrate binding protein FerR (iron transport regulator)
MKTIMLPDGSTIILNAHSSIAYLKHAQSDQPRKVKLNGEAFFKVKHLNNNPDKIKESERFIVSTSDLDVEVLGTTFDVRNRHGQTDVILETGKVRVVFNNTNQKEITMLPGEMIAYRPLKNELDRSVTDPVLETSWKDKKLILNNATVNTIIQYLEDNYGYHAVLKDTAIGNKKMEGTLLLDNFQDILFVLSTSLDIKIEKKDSTLIFSKMPSAH